MSRLCRLKTASHGDDGKWAYDEIVSLRKQRDELLARMDVVCDVQIISAAYDRIREDQLFAVDDFEYDLFASGWKAAIASVKGEQ